MRNKGYILLMVLMLAINSSCTKPYDPGQIKSVTGYLVVEGVIGAGTDSTKIRLSRTVSLTADSALNPVNGATVTIQGNDNSSYSLTAGAGGVYSSPSLNIDNTKQYRIDIKTTNGSEYQSDYVPVKITPPIDTVGYIVQNNELEIYANAHDGTNNTRYYRWEFGETWQFHSFYDSGYESNGDTVLQRPASDQIYYCFTSDSSTNIVLGSSAKLAQDVISEQPIQTIPSTSEKIETEYSIIVYQYALTNDAYNFWTLLKTNTEQLGSIFDAQPSQLSSNIHCLTNPGETVVGYMSASTRQSKRIFIHNSVLPQSWRATYPYQCTLDSAMFKPEPPYYYEDNFFNWLKPGAPAKDTYIPIAAIYDKEGISLIGQTGSTRVCVDCTIRGKVAPPAFWQY
jgi:hypothetical protein